VAGATQDFLHHGVVLGRQEDAALQRPEIDDVADQENVFAVVLLEKIQKPCRLAGARAEMDVREKQRADPAATVS
jgi:hypothetical protein